MCGISEYETSLVAQMVRHLSTMQESWVRSLGWEDSMEKEMATRSSTLAWKIPWMEEPDRLYSPWGRKESDMTERLHFTADTIFLRTLWISCGWHSNTLHYKEATSTTFFEIILSLSLALVEMTEGQTDF